MPKLDGRTIEGRLANQLAEICGTKDFHVQVLIHVGHYVGLTYGQSLRALDRLLKKGVLGQMPDKPNWYFLS